MAKSKITLRRFRSVAYLKMHGYYFVGIRGNSIYKVDLIPTGLGLKLEDRKIKTLDERSQ